MEEPTSVFHDISTGERFTSSELIHNSSTSGSTRFRFDANKVIDSPFTQVGFVSIGGKYPYDIWREQIIGMNLLVGEENTAIVLGAKSMNLSTAIFLGAKHPFRSVPFNRKISILNLLPQGQGVLVLPYDRNGKIEPDTNWFKKTVAQAPANNDHVIVHISTNYNLSPEAAKAIDPNAHVVQIVPTQAPLFLKEDMNLADAQLEIAKFVEEAANGFQRVSVTFAGPVALAIIVGNVLSTGVYAGRTLIWDFVAGKYVYAYAL